MKLFRLLYTAFLLCVGCFLCSFSLSAQKRGSKSFTLVLDPGHGGKDAGACANKGKEKDINLAVALEVKRLLKEQFPEVKVMMTRSTDVFIGLRERTQFANRNKADLFISIHTNSAPSRTAQGIETYVLGLGDSRMEANLRVAMRENESILLEDNYSVKYQGFDPSSTESYIMFEMMQNLHLAQSIEIADLVQKAFKELQRPNRSVRQAGFLVLRETAMPAILIELGFITHPEEAAYMLGTHGQTQLARSIVKGFAKYYKKHCNDKQLPHN